MHEVSKKVTPSKNESNGFVAKRLFVTDEVSKKVFQHKRKMELREGKPLRWEDAANELLTKATKSIKL